MDTNQCCRRCRIHCPPTPNQPENGEQLQSAAHQQPASRPFRSAVSIEIRPYSGATYWRTLDTNFSVATMDPLARPNVDMFRRNERHNMSTYATLHLVPSSARRATSQMHVSTQQNFGQIISSRSATFQSQNPIRYFEPTNLMYGRIYIYYMKTLCDENNFIRITEPPQYISHPNRITTTIVRNVAAEQDMGPRADVPYNDNRLLVLSQKVIARKTYISTFRKNTACNKSEPDNCSVCLLEYEDLCSLRYKTKSLMFKKNMILTRDEIVYLDICRASTDFTRNALTDG